jgi:hypothetical protein
MPWPEGGSGVGGFSFILLVVLQAQAKVKPLAMRLLPHRSI